MQQFDGLTLANRGIADDTRGIPMLHGRQGLHHVRSSLTNERLVLDIQLSIWNQHTFAGRDSVERVLKLQWYENLYV